ncbi:hypothetical protein C8F01DRAFT_1372452 [Mycena amicta]|nr:hypothetical protein C8F01DRAFT_1372452 [Mycena amicta]
MATTTEILFNSPALHALKRDQLVKLCKIHSLKANGKNTDLIDRLKGHALSLPNDNPLSVALRSEQTHDVDMEEDRRPRPSSQWEIVMDSIIEEDEGSGSGSSQGTLTSLGSASTLTGEFGTGSSNSKTTTVGSSIRALASSLGLKRHATTSTASSKTKIIASFPLPPQTDELMNNSVPYDSLPLTSLDDLQTDHFTFDTADPIVVQAHLNPSLGTAPLPGHSLRPGMPAPVNARLSLGLAPRTPSKQGPTTTLRLVSNGGATIGDTPKLKPFNTTFELDMGSPTAAAPAFPASIYPALPASPPDDPVERRISLEADHRIHLTVTDDNAEDVPMPGAFGFGATSTPPRTTTPFVFGSPSPQSAAFSFKMSSPDAATKSKVATDILQEMNQRAFGGEPPVSSSATFREIRPLPGSAKKSGIAKPVGRFDKIHERMESKMESIVDTAARREALKRKSSATSMRLGGPSADADQGRGKRVRVDEAGIKSDDDEAAKVEKRRIAEQDAIRRKIEISRARRRSSAAAGGVRRKSGRVSGAGVLVKPKPAPQRGRFGFFSGAAKLVQGVWGGKKATSATTGTQKTTAAKTTAIAKPVAGPSMAPPPITASTSANADTKSLRAPSIRSTMTTTSTRSTAASRARSPLPPAFVGTATSTTSRTRNSSIAGPSSVGTRTTTSSRSSLQVGSLGTRGSLSSVDSARKTRPSSSSSSRLLAPTASSLAKRSRNTSPSLSPAPQGHGLPSVSESKDGNPGVLDSIANTIPVSVNEKGTGKGKGKATPLGTRKPRISRSRVIAKLASQRVASGSSIASVSSQASRKSLGGGPIAPRVRSSLGAKVQRGSLGGMKNQVSGLGPVDAKRRARQSEYYARRASKAGADTGDAMKVDS